MTGGTCDNACIPLVPASQHVARYLSVIGITLKIHIYFSPKAITEVTLKASIVTHKPHLVPVVFMLFGAHQ